MSNFWFIWPLSYKEDCSREWRHYSWSCSCNSLCAVMEQTLCLNWVTFLTLEDLTVFFVYSFIELVVLLQRNSALRNEALAYLPLVSELVTCLDAVCFSLLVEETAINYGCRKRQKLGEKSKIKFDKSR